MSASTHPGPIHDVVIVGSGPAGYTAAVYTARASLAPLVFEGSVTAGGALMNTTEVENYPGFTDGIMGPDLMAQMRAQAERFGARLVTDDVTALDLSGEIKTVKDSEGTVHHARAVILATGSQHRLLGLENEERLGGRGVSYCATCDGFFFRSKTVAVLGGGDTALEDATFLTKFAEKVYVLVRSDRLRASKAMQERAHSNPKIEFVFNTVVTDLYGEDVLTGIGVEIDGSYDELAVDGLFIAIGHDPRSSLFDGQVDLDEDGYVKVASPNTSTNLPGVFACGDLVDRNYRQAITAAGSGCAAALDAERFLAAQEG